MDAHITSPHTHTHFQPFVTTESCSDVIATPPHPAPSVMTVYSTGTTTFAPTPSAVARADPCRPHHYSLFQTTQKSLDHCQASQRCGRCGCPGVSGCPRTPPTHTHSSSLPPLLLKIHRFPEMQTPGWRSALEEKFDTVSQKSPSGRHFS